MSIETVAARLGASPEAALALEKTCHRFDIDSVFEVSHFLSQLMEESRNFTRTRENLNYRRDKIRGTFGTHRITDAELYQVYKGRLYPVDVQLFANCVYGGEYGREELGNTQPDDGWRFIGRGYPQITGRENYTRYSIAIYDDLRCVERPEILEHLPDAATCAGWFWRYRNIGRVARGTDVAAVTRLVNGGTTGLKKRQANFQRALNEFSKLRGEV